MVTKDLFERFAVSYEKIHGYSYDDDVSYLLDSDISPYTNEKLPQEMETFLRKITNLHQRINLMKKLTMELQKKQSEILTSTSSDELLTEEHDKLLATIKQTSKYLNKDIKGLRENTEKEKMDRDFQVNNNWSQKNENSISLDEKIKRDQLNILVVLFQEVMSEYNQVQLAHRNQCKNRIKRQFQLIDKSVDNEEIEEMLEQGNLTVIHQGISFKDMDQANRSLKIVEDRQADILKLEKSIRDLFEIFQELAILVESQGDMIESIQRNVQETITLVAETKKTLHRAKKYQRRTIFTFCCPVFLRKSMCCTVM